MPDWYVLLQDARYARMPAPAFAALPMYWQDAYRAARLAEADAGVLEPELEELG